MVAVVVTYDRPDLLRLTLAGIDGARMRPAAVVVVDNASGPQTARVLAEHRGSVPLDVVRLERNLGGAGGFAAGIDRALHRHDAELVWVMDDDTEPQPDTLAELVRTWRDYAEDPTRRPAFVASRVVWTDGREHPMNSMRERILPGAARRRRAARVGARTIRSGSFVSLLMDATPMRRTGLPLAEYFIWNDDFEYSTRLARFRDAVQAPASVAVHRTKTFGTTDADPGPRFYFDVRNKLWVFTRSASLAPWEKVLYFGATLRLWLRTFRGASDRRVVAGRLLRGVRDALRAPRPTDEVLRGCYDLRRHAVPGEREPEVDPQAQVEDEVFSVLMPVYRGDTAEGLRRALESNLFEQRLRPSQLVLAEDGALPEDLHAVIREVTARAREAGIDVVVLQRTEHRGLPSTLNEGLSACTHRVVARADADDVSLPERFARQVPPVVEGRYTVLGAGLREADASLTRIEAERRMETDPRRIRRAARLRNPLAHPTVVFDAEAVREVGGYEEVPGAEDYALWMRLLARGDRLGNLPEPLVVYRAGAAAWDRRGGMGALRRELLLQRHLREAGHIGPATALRNVVVRGGYRVIPRAWRIRAFRALIGSGRTRRGLRGGQGPATEGREQPA